jgi:uncharacterized membrane protein
MDKYYLASGVLLFGLLIEMAIFIILLRKKQGFGTNTIRLIGIVAVIVLTAAIVLSEVSNIEPAMAILGAVAGYLFGFSEKKASVD